MPHYRSTVNGATVTTIADENPNTDVYVDVTPPDDRVVVNDDKPAKVSKNASNQSGGSLDDADKDSKTDDPSKDDATPEANADATADTKEDA